MRNIKVNHKKLDIPFHWIGVVYKSAVNIYAHLYIS